MLFNCKLSLRRALAFWNYHLKKFSLLVGIVAVLLAIEVAYRLAAVAANKFGAGFRDLLLYQSGAAKNTPGSSSRSVL